METLKLVITPDRPGAAGSEVIEIQPEELKEFSINTNYGGSVVFWDKPYCYRIFAINGKVLLGNPQELHQKFVDEYGISLDFVEIRY
jgi:hypothetical protein